MVFFFMPSPELNPCFLIRHSLQHVLAHVPPETEAKQLQQSLLNSGWISTRCARSSEAFMLVKGASAEVFLNILVFLQSASVWVQLFCLVIAPNLASSEIQ